MIAINQQNFEELYHLKPKRIYFSEQSRNTILKKLNNSNAYGTLNFPFSESIQKMFEKDTKLELFANTNDKYDNKTAVWRSIANEDEFNVIEKWITKQETTVFIRSLLPLCIALDLNVDYDNKLKTKIGDLEYSAKSNENEQAIKLLVDLLCERIKNSAFYKTAVYIAAVPADKNKPFDLPTLLAKNIAKKLGIDDITNKFSYQNPKKALKSIDISEKWQQLEQSKLKFERQNLANKPIILLDDKYQSGTTLHYLAMKLNDAGFDNIYGLVIVKTIRDDDNQ